MLLRHSVLFSAIVAALGAPPAEGEKYAAVDKVMELMRALQTSIMQEGEAEAQTYNKFACFCKSTTTDKQTAIQEKQNRLSQVKAYLPVLTGFRETMDSEIIRVQGEIVLVENYIKNKKQQRRSEQDLYESNSADVRAALVGLEGAIKSMRESKAPSLLQVAPVAETLRTALVLADALGLVDSKNSGVLSMIQGPGNGDPPDVPMEDYKYHSGDVIKTLNELQKEFILRRDKLNKDEVEAVAQHTQNMQAKKNDIKKFNVELDTFRKDRQSAIASIAEQSQIMATIESDLREDIKYTHELYQMCTDKAKTWDQRMSTRALELSTLVQAMDIIDTQVRGNISQSTLRFVQKGTSVRVAKVVASSAGAMEAIEAAAEEADAPPALVQLTAKLRGTQKHRGPLDGRSAVAQVLEGSGKQLKSTLLTELAGKISEDPFAKVKQLIQELIERLLTEESREANQKGWCDKSQGDAREKRDDAAQEISEANAVIARNEAIRDQMAEDISQLNDEIQTLTWQRGNTSDERAQEKIENTATIDEANLGLQALNQCITMLQQWYQSNAGNAVNLGLVQQGPGDDAPDAGFKIGEAYVGGQSASVGILGMLDVMKSDFLRTVSETEAAENQAQSDFLVFLAEINSAIAEKEEARTGKTDTKTDAENAMGDGWSKLFTSKGVLVNTIMELIQLKAVCIDTGMSYDDRVAKREEEIKALNKAMCIFENYEKYGPGGASSGC